MYEVVVIGVGRMGLPIAQGLVASGRQVAVFDVDAGRRSAAQGVGAEWLSSEEDLASAVVSRPVILTVLPGSPELRDLMLGSDGTTGLLGTLTEGTLWIDMTSADPRLGRVLAAAADGQAVRYVDAGIGGGPRDARAGTLRLYVGGRSADVDMAGELLEVLAARGLVHVGAAGSGYLVKLLINQLWFTQALALAETLSLATNIGLSPAALVAALEDSPADSAFVRDYLSRLLTGDAIPAFGLDRIVEELDSLSALAAERSAPWTVSDAVADVHRAALNLHGPVAGELFAAQAHLRGRSGPTG